MICVHCLQPDRAYWNGFRLETKHPANAKELFCSNCTQVFLAKREAMIPWTEKKVINSKRRRRRR